MRVDWKETLLMPKTDFAMKGSLTSKEPEFRKKWLEMGLYQKTLDSRKDAKSFILHDGPPYANGPLHVGHALNKILKDIIVRHKTMAGFYAPFVPGWDTHGLPIENKMLKEINAKKDDFNAISLRKKAQEYALGQVKMQKNQFLQMQLLSDFSTIYTTLDRDFITEQLKLFKKIVLNGQVFKGLKPVFWSPSSQSALAEAEVEYKNITSPELIVAFKVIKENTFISEGDLLLIMTTTPWTLIANSGVAINQKLNYSVVQVKTKRFVVASERLEQISEALGWDNYSVLRKIGGKSMIGIEYQRPLQSSKVGRVVSGFHVDSSVGTGLVHMAPLFGEDDFIVGKKNKLEMIMHVNDDGTLNEDAGIFQGQFYQSANKAIGEYLKKEDLLLSLRFIKHSYPHDWRTHQPVIYRGTPQWFVSIDKVRSQILKQLSKVTFFPAWGKDRLMNMIENRGDWTISRQRTWGVPIIIFYDQKNEVVKDEAIFDYVINLISQEGLNIWWEWSTDELLPPKYQGLSWSREKDIMDVWFDSGSSALNLLNKGFKLPFDLYLEGSDQYRGWFNSSAINTILMKDKLPFKSIVSHGFTLDKKGQKMSKSKGNVVDPMKIIAQQGADILRLWVANSEFTSDVTISDEIIKQNADLYRSIRNKIRFMLGNLSDFDPQTKVSLVRVHALVAEQLDNLKYNVAQWYKNYKFINVIKGLNQFLIELSGFYFELAKDSLYCDKVNGTSRLAFQKNLYNILDFLLISLAPILPTTAEDAYEHFKKENKKESIHLEDFNFSGSLQKVEQEKWAPFFDLKSKVYRLIEEKKQQGTISRVNEVELSYETKDDFLNQLDLRYLLMVGKISNGPEVSIKKFVSKKCNRCWNHYKSLTEENICSRCDGVVNG